MLSGLLTVYVGSIVVLVCELWRTRDAAVVVSLRHQRALYAIGVALFLSHTVLSMKPSLWP